MTLHGILAGIFIAEDLNSLISKRVTSIKVLENGLEGDKHQNWFRKADVRVKRYPKGTIVWNSRQISVVSEEELELIAKDLGVPKIEPQWLGANICLKGVPNLSLLPPRTKIFIQNDNGGPEVGLYATAPNKPCIGPGEVIENYYCNLTSNYLQFVHLGCKFPKAAQNRRGLVAVVECPGIVKEGAKVSVVVQ